MLSDEGARVWESFHSLTKVHCPDSLGYIPPYSTIVTRQIYLIEEVTIHRRRRVNSFVNPKCSLVRIIDPG